MKYKSLFLAIPLLCFVACSSNDDVEEPENNLKRPIRVTVSEAPLTDTLTAHAHKSPITDKSTLKQFCLNYDFEDEFSDPLLFTNPIEVAGEWIWESQSQGNWPQSAGDNDMVPFYAYAGIDTEYDVAEKDDYVDKLRYEYDYLRYKYQLSPIGSHQWNWLRLRPQNFPSMRSRETPKICW